MKANPFKIAFLYLAVSIGWIVSSDYLVHQLSLLITFPDHILQTSKGVFFIIITAVLLYLIIKKQQQSLLRSEKQYKSLFYANPNPLWIYDLNTLKFLEVNDAAIHRYGYSRKEFQSMTIMDIRPAEDYQRVAASANNMPEGTHISGYWKHLDKDGRTFIVSIESHKINFDNKECVIVIAQDVTQKFLQEERLRKSAEENKMLADVVQRVNNIVIITDPDGKITWVNRAFTDITGYSFDEAIGRYTSILHGPKTDTETQRLIMECVQRREFCSFEILNYTKSGQEYWVELNLSAIYNERNEIERYIAIQNIITERKEKEAKIKHQNEILRKIAWVNSHSLRKPIASIISLTNLCKDVNTLDEMKEMHCLIEDCSKELDEIIKEISGKINRIESL